MGDTYSYCKYIIPRIYGKCRCKDGYQLSKDNQCLPSKPLAQIDEWCNRTDNDCLFLVKVLLSKCHTSADCAKVTLDSYCADYINGDSVCNCKRGFSMSDNKLSCEPLPTTTTEASGKLLEFSGDEHDCDQQLSRIRS